MPCTGHGKHRCLRREKPPGTRIDEQLRYVQTSSSAEQRYHQSPLRLPVLIFVLQIHFCDACSRGTSAWVCGTGLEQGSVKIQLGSSLYE